VSNEKGCAITCIVALVGIWGYLCVSTTLSQSCPSCGSTMLYSKIFDFTKTGYFYQFIFNVILGLIFLTLKSARVYALTCGVAEIGVFAISSISTHNLSNLFYWIGLLGVLSFIGLGVLGIAIYEEDIFQLKSSDLSDEGTDKTPPEVIVLINSIYFVMGVYVFAIIFHIGFITTFLQYFFIWPNIAEVFIIPTFYGVSFFVMFVSGMTNGFSMKERETRVNKVSFILAIIATITTGLNFLAISLRWPFLFIGGIYVGGFFLIQTINYVIKIKKDKGGMLAISVLIFVIAMLLFIENFDLFVNNFEIINIQFASLYFIGLIAGLRFHKQ
jgi:hypothetical protein